MAHLASTFRKNIKKLIQRKRPNRPNSRDRAAKTLGLVVAAALTLAANATLVQPTSAAASPQKIWSFGQARWLGETYAALIDEQCQHDAACELKIYAALRSSGDDNAYIASLFNNTQFMFIHLAPYKPRFTYWFNDMAPSNTRRDYDRPEPLYPTAKSAVTFHYSNSTSAQVFNLGLTRGRTPGSYTLISKYVPAGLHVTGISIDLETTGQDGQPLVHLIHTSDFNDCLTDDSFNTDMVCESYFTLEGRKTRPVHPDNLSFEPEPIADFQPVSIPGVFEPKTDPTPGPSDSDDDPDLNPSNPDLGPTDPAGNQPNHDSQTSDQTSDQTSNQPLEIPNTGSTNSSAPTPQNQLSLTGALKAPNTSTANSSDDTGTPYQMLAALMLFLVAFFISVPFSLTFRKNSRKKSRKTLDIRSKVR